MQSSVLTKPDMADTDLLDRRRPGRFDDVSLELVPILRGDIPAQTGHMVSEPNLLPDYAAVTISARDPVAERQTGFKIMLIIVALVGVVLLLGK